MADNLIFFWVLWAITLASVVYAIVGSYFKERNIYGVPLLLGLMFGHFYVFQIYVVATNLDYLLDPWMFEFGQAVSLVCFWALLLGWNWGLHRGVSSVSLNNEKHSLNY